MPPGTHRQACVHQIVRSCVLATLSHRNLKHSRLAEAVWSAHHPLLPSPSHLCMDLVLQPEPQFEPRAAKGYMGLNLPSGRQLENALQKMTHSRNSH
eukprot:94981-Chlamydomonas_euryale.AAC.1